MRRLGLVLLLSPIGLAACGGEPPPPPPDVILDQATPPLRFDYLPRLRFNVASIDIQDQVPPPGPGEVSQQAPVPLVQALRQMAQDRLATGGSTGRAVFVIENASIQRGPGGALVGTLAVRLDIYSGGSSPTAYAEARVSRTLTDPDGPLRRNLDTMTRQMMNDMNVEFEYQVRHSLKDWLQDTTPIAAPAPVQAQPLGPQSGSPPSGMSLQGVPPPGTPVFAPPTTLAPPTALTPQTLAPPAGTAPSLGPQPLNPPMTLQPPTAPQGY